MALKRLFSLMLGLKPRQTRKRSQEQELNQLREAYNARFKSFTSLLAFNNTALELMTEIEAALQGGKPFGMTFVRSRCTRVAACVYRIIQHLNEISDGKYDALHLRFRSIRDKVHEHIDPMVGQSKGALTLPMDEVGLALVDEVGSKMATLGEVAGRLQVAIPQGFVITATGYHAFLSGDLREEVTRRLQAAGAEDLDALYALSSSVRQFIMRAALPEELRQAIEEQCLALTPPAGREIMLCLRSSALGEDAKGSSFAGQYLSVLGVHPREACDTYKEVVAGKYGPTAMAYRINHGLRDDEVTMSVGCMVMVDAAAGGVAYSVNPTRHDDDRVHVDAVWGLPKAVVDGDIDPDRFVVARGDKLTIESQSVASKNVCYRLDRIQGVCLSPLDPHQRSSPCLTPGQVLAVADLALRIERLFGEPQDVEWAFDQEGELVLLQCRPLHRTQSRERLKDIPASAEILVSGGICAGPGAASGPIYIVRKDADALTFPPGAVLVAAQAQPRWAPLLSRAAAVIAERGSITGHLANVCREYGVPALFGISEALEVLEQGQMVTVDADAGAVLKGRIAEAYTKETKPKNLMYGSPVWKTLSAAAEHIVPLTLLDPDSPDFLPESCRTFHDITRFCHEHAVTEMFLGDTARKFPQHAAKQLYHNRPMRYWIIDLGDGFARPVSDKLVQLCDIASRPMLAMWRGMMHVPWSGPPPVNTKGFMSVMFEAATTPSLEPSANNPLAEKNFFIISKNFVCLQARFGFHFSTAEAHVTDNPAENYAGFRFKGGAADLPRRERRARLVGAVLEEYGFKVRQNQDSLSARAEGYESEEMLRMAEVLGYLTLHTRQLDMCMDNERVFDQQLAAINADLARLCEEAEPKADAEPDEHRQGPMNAL